MQKETLGYIGPGIMGRPMIENLRKAGFPVIAYARRKTVRQALEADGIGTAESPADLAAQCRVVFSCVGDTSDVENVLLGKNGIIETAAPGTIVIDMSTISPEATKKMAATLAEKNIHLLDAPVSGGEQGAIDGTLSIMVGGKKEIFDRMKPLLEILGKNIVYIGGHGTGQITKACNQVLVAQTITAVAEALALAEAVGADPARVRKALLGGFAYSRILECMANACWTEIISRDSKQHCTPRTCASFVKQRNPCHCNCRAQDWRHGICRNWLRKEMGSWIPRRSGKCTDYTVSENHSTSISTRPTTSAITAYRKSSYTNR